MPFNLWRKYPRYKPKWEGWYQCTVTYDNLTYVVDLYFVDIEGGQWFDNRRMTVFEGYKVYKQCREPLEYNRVFYDGLCNRTAEVVAWKKLPRIYGWWRKETE